MGCAGVPPKQVAGAIMRSVPCDQDALKSPEVLRQRICDCVRAEFARGAVVNIDGWILSVTEARLYALVTLVAAGDPARRRMGDRQAQARISARG